MITPLGTSLWTADLHERLACLARSARRHLVIFSPFIRTEALRTIVEGASAELISVVTVWSARSVLDGGADLELYPYTKSRGIRLYILPRLHMKAVVADLARAAISTANITGHGLGLLSPANIECAAFVSDLDVGDRLWFVRQLRSALLVQDDYYFAFRDFIERMKATTLQPPNESFRADVFANRKQFLLDSLPQSPTPDALLAGILRIDAEGTGSIEPEDLVDLLHDAALYGLEPSCGAIENWRRLRQNFLNHQFVEAFLESIEGRRYFGEAKAWLQKHCADIPIPPRRKLTDCTRILFDWVSTLGEDNFVLARPHYSECLVRKCASHCVTALEERVGPALSAARDEA